MALFFRSAPAPVVPRPESLHLATVAGSVGLWEWDLVTNQVKWTDSVYAIYGLDRAAFAPSLDQFIRLVHAEDLPRVQAAIDAALKSDAPYELEFRIARPGGQTGWVFVNGTVLRERGKAVRMVGAVVDITATHHADDVSLRLAAIVESSDDAILSKDLTGLITTWNAGAERIFGYTAAEAIGRPITMLIPPQYQNEEPEILVRILAGETVAHYETVRQRKDGSIVDIALTVSPIKDRSGRIVGASKIARDISDRKRAEEALRSSEERFRLLANHAPVGIFLSDATGRCIFVNQSWTTLTGLAQDQAQGEGWVNALHPDDRAGVLAGWREAVARGQPSTSEFRFLRPDGRVVWVHGHAVQFDDGQTFHGYMGSCVDITQRKQAELQSHFLQALADELGALRDPTAIMSAAQRALGQFLGVDRCYFYEVCPDGKAVCVLGDWHREGLASIAGRHELASFGSPAILKTVGRPRRHIPDVREDPVLRAAAVAYEKIGLRSFATSAYWRDGTWRITLAVGSANVRHWTPEEVELVENVAGRVWPIVERARADVALRESEQLYRTIGDSIDYGVWMSDPAGRNLYASDSFLKLVGVTQEQCANLGWTELLHPDDVAATTAAWLECVRTGGVWEREHRFRGADGKWHPVLARGNPIRDESGQIVRWVGINLDIAAYKRAQDTARHRMSVLEKLNEIGRRLVSELDVERIVQLVTDTGREVSGAAWGAFFYTVRHGDGEAQLRYTPSGLPQDEFAGLPLPRSTGQLGPAFRGDAPVRVDDLRADPALAHHLPPFGEAPGQLPVRSYLAVPVKSRTGEILGGLFFGHPEAGVFTAETETVLAAVAASAAIAIDNAQLHAALQKELAEQRHTEMRLRDSETRWRQLAEAMPHLVWTCRPDGYCDYLSPQWIAYTGVHELEQLGDGWMEFIHPDDRDELGRRWMEVTQTGEMLDTEFRIRRVDGRYRWFKTRAVPVRDGEGRIIKWYGTNTDVEDFRQIEQAIRKSEYQLRLVTDHAPVYLVQCDRSHHFKFVNLPYAERFRLNREDVIGRHVSELTGAAAYGTFKVHMDSCLTGRRVEFEQEIPYSTLGRRWVHVIYEPERGADGEITGLVGVITDITTRKQAEVELARARDDALAASRAKDDFLAALSHELRTPLSPVLLVASDAANNPALPPEVRESFELIRTNVSLEARLIDDLLDLTRITRGKMSLEKQPLDVHDVLRDALATLRPEMEAKRIELEIQPAATRSMVLGDPVRLQQVLWNILTNAVKFTPDGGRIRVVTEAAAGPDRITVEIADNGMGMTPGELARVFEAFTQGEHASPAGSHRFGGLGLGLAISQRLVELHAGRIYATSEGRGCGSIFVIELPLLAVDRAGHALAEPPTPATMAAPGAGTRLLLVEDHPSTRETLQKLLTRRGYQVLAAGSAAEAHALAATHPFDILISDVGLPDGDGYQLMSALRVLHPGLQGIAISGYGMEDDLRRSHAAGFALHLVKPVGIAALETALAGLTSTVR